MSLSLVRLPDVLERRGDGRTNLYRDIERQKWTPPIRLGLRYAVWPSSEIDTLIAARVAGATDEQLRSLVRGLMAHRKVLMPKLDEPCESVTGATPEAA
jgi:prophage regulatory protein